MEKAYEEQFKGNCTVEFSFGLMGLVLNLEQPDLVIINGDLFAENARREDNVVYPMYTAGAIAKANFPVIGRGLPFATTWGNHDAEGTLLVSHISSWSFSNVYLG